jgi:YHS domain-containing protein
MPRDPVCGKEVEHRTAFATADYVQARYYFCSEECSRAFEGDPDGYAREDREIRKRRILESLFR